MNNVNKDIKKMKTSETKKDIILLRIKNGYYSKHTVIDKVIDELLNEQFDNTPSKRKNRITNRS